MQDEAFFGPLAKLVEHTRGAPTATILGRTVHLIGAADARAEGKLRGLTAYLIAIDEATLLPEDYVAQALARLSVPGASCLMTTNPGPPAHWLRKKYILRAGELDLRTWHFTLDDNPALPADYVASLKAELTGMFYRRMVLGEWCAGDGAIWEGFDPERHVVKDVPPGTMVLAVGVDYGNVNPFAALMLGLTPDGRLIFMREWRYESKLTHKQMTDAEYSKALAGWITPDAPRYLVVDPSAASFRVQLHRDAVGTVAPADNEVLDGVREVASLFATNRLLVHESCTGLIDEIPGYSWDDEKAEKGEDAPVKVDDHSCDAARYAIRTTRTLWRSQIAAPERFALLPA